MGQKCRINYINVNYLVRIYDSSMPPRSLEAPLSCRAVRNRTTHRWKFQSRLYFLSPWPYPGYGGHITVPHETFPPTCIPVSAEISLLYNNRGLFSPAPLPTVDISSMAPYFLESFLKGQRHGLFAAMSASDQFDYFTRGDVIPTLRILSAISTNCRFFCSQVYERHLSSILATEGVPSSDRLLNTLSVYAFLSMNPDNDSLSLLPGEGWSNILGPQRFVASIQ